MRTGRPTTRATEGMIATPHYLASLAGLRVLQDGGNAVDAAIAANATLNVVYPHMCSLGGDAFFLIWDPASARLHALNGSGRSAAGASIGALRERDIQQMPSRGAHTVTVPGVVSAWDTVLKAFGSRPLSVLLEPAANYAERGFPLTPSVSSAIANGRDLLEKQTAAATQFLPNGQAPAAGQILRQPDLAASLRLIGEQGPQAVYQGPIGEAIVNTVRSNGGLMTTDDLASHKSNWVDPLQTSYRGIDLIELPPNTQGLVAVQLANIAEGWDIASMGRNSADQIHHFVEAKKLAFIDRERYITDPEFHDIPLDKLASKEYAASLRDRISSERADLNLYDPVGGGDTIYMCVVDRDGLCVSLIQSLFSGFGSGLVAEGAGIVLQNRGASFTLNETAANRLEPGKRPMHTLIPGMLLKDGQPWTVFGSMGGHGQAQTHLQLLSNFVDFGLEPQAAIESPRWVSGRGGPNDPQNILDVEPEIGEDVIQQLRDRGHQVRLTESFSSEMGHANAIHLDRENGVLLGGSDPRSDGAALGW